ncbi:hypothetical protein SELMODRAFT_417487 [Selaginella moellendorffii]|uniref:Uncharacterized protein n=1 Tax=Selaginella moellendorffii TaxID=88036 RepID=D8S2D8_SELML|nr:hypothetical protein SELMODRAFT_417487 [Selaginella moellendorffii]
MKSKPLVQHAYGGIDTQLVTYLREMSKRLTDYENSIAALVVNVICSFYTLFLLDRIVLHIIAPCLSGSTASFKLQTRKKKKETVPQSISIPPVATGGEPEFMTVKSLCFQVTWALC